MDSFAQKTIQGVSWSVVGRVGKNIIGFVVGVVLARLLSPTEFGLLGMITVITRFANLFTDMGFGAALIQKKEINDRELSSVFWLNMAGGILLTLIFIALSPVIASFYNEPILQILTIVLSFNFVIQSAVIVQKTQLTRSIDFKSLSIVEVASIFLSGAVGIAFAYYDYGVWSLVIHAISGSVFITVLIWYLSDWRPSAVFDIGAIKRLLGFSLNLLGDKTINYWARNLDNLLIGKYLGSDPLGVYSKSYSIMLLPLQNVSNVISRVMFPALSKIQDDKERVKRIFLRMTRVIALVTFPMMLGLVVVVEPFVITVFGKIGRAHV